VAPPKSSMASQNWEASRRIWMEVDKSLIEMVSWLSLEAENKSLGEAD
jgi:hypothetical protein